MKVQVGSYYLDDHRDEQREIHVTLDDSDAMKIFPNSWEGWDVEEQFRKLSAIADILQLRYAGSRGFRRDDAVAEKVENIIAQDLT